MKPDQKTLILSRHRHESLKHEFSFSSIPKLSRRWKSSINRDCLTSPIKGTLRGLSGSITGAYWVRRLIESICAYYVRRLIQSNSSHPICLSSKWRAQNGAKAGVKVFFLNEVNLLSPVDDGSRNSLCSHIDKLFARFIPHWSYLSSWNNLIFCLNMQIMLLFWRVPDQSFSMG